MRQTRPKQLELSPKLIETSSNLVDSAEIWSTAPRVWLKSKMCRKRLARALF